MKKLVKISDGIVTPDQLGFSCNSIKTGFDTRVVVTAKNCISDGSKQTQVLANKTVLPGRTHLLETVFPIEPDLDAQHLFLNDNVLGEYNHEDGKPLDTASKVMGSISNVSLLPRFNPRLFRRRNVQYWCAGDGAMNKTIISQSYPSHSTNTRLYHMIPFRFVRADAPLSVEDQRKYKFKVTYGSSSPYYGYVGYYFKKINFSKLTGINSEVDKVPYSPSWADTAPDLNAATEGYQNALRGDKTQSNFVDMTMNIESNEFKEWFIFNDATLENATISELGLVLGLDCYVTGGNTSTPTYDIIQDLDPQDEGYDLKVQRSEVYDAELFAHLTFDPYKVSRENALIDFEYRIYS